MSFPPRRIRSFVAAAAVLARWHRPIRDDLIRSGLTAAATSHKVAAPNPLVGPRVGPQDDWQVEYNMFLAGALAPRRPTYDPQVSLLPAASRVRLVRAGPPAGRRHTWLCRAVRGLFKPNAPAGLEPA